MCTYNLDRDWLPNDNYSQGLCIMNKIFGALNVHHK